MNCDEARERLLDYAEGLADADESLRLRAHLDGCDACRVRFRETRALIGELSVARSIDCQAWRSTGPAAPRSATLAPGTKLGDFEIQAELGSGGMGAVYRARQGSLNRIIALKVLSAQGPAAQRAIARFQREAQAAARLHHTNIVPVYAQGEADGLYYYAMELVEGESLDKRIASDRDTSAPPRDFRRIAALLAGVADGLHHAHELGVIHRDIKPQNLMLDRKGELRITDFGLARLLDEPAMTLSAELIGTPAYMAPEQIQGRRGAVDRRTDVYALGVTLYEWLALRRPFEGDTYERMIHEILHSEPAAPRRLAPVIPRDLETICLRAIEKAPDRRYASAGELAAELRRFASARSIQTRRATWSERAIRWVRRHPARATAAGAVAGLLLLSLVTVGVVRAKGAEEIANAWETLIANYRDHRAARDKMGWMSRLGGDGYRRRMVLGLADLQTDTDRAIGILNETARRWPGRADTFYLLAWAHARLERSQDQMARALGQIRAGDEAPVAASPEGQFFRGQALLSHYPREADASFQRAIRGRLGFVQAMQQQGRALNTIMYVTHDRAYYEKAVASGEAACALQPRAAYPRYVLALTHLQYAEILALEAQSQQSGELRQAAILQAYDACERLLDEGHALEPRESAVFHGYAQLYESRAIGLAKPEDFRRSIQAWERMGSEAALKTDDDNIRHHYEMRLRFWLGDLSAAETRRAQRYADSPLDPDSAWYAAIIRASQGETREAGRLLQAAADRTERAEGLLLLHSAACLVGAPLTDLERRLAGTRNDHLSPGWTTGWIDELEAYATGELSWATSDELEASIRAHVANAEWTRDFAPWDESYVLRASAEFYRGMRALTAGDREQAIERFRASWLASDNETYCFRAKMLLFKLLLDPGWPAWERGRRLSP